MSDVYIRATGGTLSVMQRTTCVEIALKLPTNSDTVCCSDKKENCSKVLLPNAQQRRSIQVLKLHCSLGSWRFYPAEPRWFGGGSGMPTKRFLCQPNFLLH